MKLNLLIVFLFGVSVSATGMRGFTPIKGDERRLTPKSSSSKSSSKSSAETTKVVAKVLITEGGEVVRCSGKKCRQFYANCVVDDDDKRTTLFPFTRSGGNSPSGSKSKSSSSDDRRVRRLKKSSSTSDDDAESELYVLRLTKTDITDNCQGDITREAVSDSPSKSSSSSKKSDDERRLKSSSSKSSADKKKTVAKVLITEGGEVVRCSGKKCRQFYDKCVVNEANPTRAFTLTRSGGNSPSGSKSKSSSSDDRRVRRLKKSSSTSDDDAESELYVLRLTKTDITDNCQGDITREAVSDSPSKSSSSSSDDERRLKSSSSKSSGDKRKTVRVIINDDLEIVRCFGSDRSCNRFYRRCGEDDDYHLGKIFLRVADDSSSGSKSKSSSSDDRRVRRLKKSSSTSKSKSSDRRTVTFRWAEIDGDCVVALGRSFDLDSESSSSSTSKKSRRQ